MSLPSVELSELFFEKSGSRWLHFISKKMKEVIIDLREKHPDLDKPNPTAHIFPFFERNYEKIASLPPELGRAVILPTIQYSHCDDPLNEGVDMKVKLTGSRYLDIKGLSGGEKTLAALAFIFSIQEFTPAPFYLLDEVDAALDKHNSEKLSKLIKQYSNRAQYIVISHNDSIITEADQIYGISMQQGISKIVSLKL